jgi:hypothetical protein
MPSVRLVSNEIGIPATIHEIQALPTITIPIVSHRQADGDSRLPTSTYCVLRRKTGIDFDIETKTEHAFEIFISTSSAWME